MLLDADAGSFELKGVADLEDVCVALGLNLANAPSDSFSSRGRDGDNRGGGYDRGDRGGDRSGGGGNSDRGGNDMSSSSSSSSSLSSYSYSEFGTISGFLCDQAGEIPEVGDVLLVDHFAFTVTDADERRIVLLHAKRIDDAADDVSCCWGHLCNKSVREHYADGWVGGGWIGRVGKRYLTYSCF